MSAINYELLSELIFTNDETFTDINIKKAKIIARVCKTARYNKNIKMSYDICKINIYHKQIMFLSIEKTEKGYELEFNEIDVFSLKNPSSTLT